MANNKKLVEQFAKLPRDLLASDAWRSAGINARRVLDFLMFEHMAHGGRQNGNLKAPYRQLAALGIGARHIPEAIHEAERLGLIECRRGGRRVANSYTVTWLDMPDGSPGSNRWRAYRRPGASHARKPKKQKSASPRECKAASLRECKGGLLHHQGNAKPPGFLHHQSDDLSRRSYQGGSDTLSSISLRDGVARGVSGAGEADKAAAD